MKKEELREYLKHSTDDLVDYDITLTGLFSLDEEIKKDYSILENINKNLLDKLNFMKQMVDINPYTLMYASERLKSDEELVLRAINKDVNVFTMASKSLMDNDNFVLKAFKSAMYDSDIIAIHMSERLKNDKDFVLNVLDSNDNIFQYICDDLKDDMNVVLKAVSICGLNLEYASERLKNSKSVVLEAIANYDVSFVDMGDTLISDKEFTLECIELIRDPIMIEHFKKFILT